MTGVRGTTARVVLVVDDDHDHAQIVRLVLAQLAPEVEVRLGASAADFLDALVLAPRGSLVLLDRRLGRTESYELLSEARRRRPDVTIVMLSTALGEADRARALHAGALEAHAEARVDHRMARAARRAPRRPCGGRRGARRVGRGT